MTIPILELPQKLGWGTKYKKLYEYYISKKLKNFQTIGKLKHHKSFGFYFESQWKKYTYKATIHFDAKSERFTHFDVVIPGGIKKFNQKDFVKTFNLLKDEFGKPNNHRGMSIDDLIKDKEYMEKGPEELPAFVWIIDGAEIIHHFIDHWGNGPETTIRKRK